MHQAVDDAPYGGGPGMVMRPQVWGEALDAVLAEGPPAQAGGAHASRAAVHPGHRAGVGHGRAARVRLRPLRGDRRARDGALRAGRGGQHRRLRAGRGRGRGARDGGGGGPAAARRARQPAARGARTRSPTACSKARPTPGPSAGAASRCRRCCAAATTPRSPGGGATGRWSAPPRAGPICSPPSRPTRSTPPTGRSWRGPPRGSRGIWHHGRRARARRALPSMPLHVILNGTSR